MKDFWRESFSYVGLCRKMNSVKKIVEPKSVSFGEDKEQYFLYYEPARTVSNKIVVWVHGGGWNAGSPDILTLWDSALQEKDTDSFRWDTDCHRPINIPASWRMSAWDTKRRYPF